MISESLDVAVRLVADRFAGEKIESLDLIAAAQDDLSNTGASDLPRTATRPGNCTCFRRPAPMQDATWPGTPSKRPGTAPVTAAGIPPRANACMARQLKTSRVIAFGRKSQYRLRRPISHANEIANGSHCFRSRSSVGLASGAAGDLPGAGAGCLAPLARHCRDSLPMGREPVPTVRAISIRGRSGGTAIAQEHGYADYWQAPIFYPPRYVRALGADAADRRGVAVDPALRACAAAYNVLLLLGLTLNGLCGFHLLRRVRLGAMRSRSSAGRRLRCFHSCGTKWGSFSSSWRLASCSRFGSCTFSPTARRRGVGVLLGLSYALTYHLCVYYGLFLAVALPLPAVWLIGALEAASHVGLARAGRGGGGCGRRAAGGGAITRQEPLPDEAARLAAEATFGQAGRLHRAALEPVVGLGESAGVRPRSHPPFPRLGDVCVSDRRSDLGDFRRRLRRWTVFCLLFGITGFALSLGPNLELRGSTPYMALADRVPGLDTARNVFRFALFAQLAVVFLGACRTASPQPFVQTPTRSVSEFGV